MTLELYQEVALTRDLPEYQLKAGDILVSHGLILFLILVVVKRAVCWKYLMLLVSL
ncbi:hypothetical protein QUA54_31775 [Microcoleus sp. MOSTC5]|uniref:hypothetical protein n=1 Tax=Microcoleus sp. MOSTC5 TaxID=3055378 RepID=UPI002FCF7FF3